jgi:putative DNA primase/helicase
MSTSENTGAAPAREADAISWEEIASEIGGDGCPEPPKEVADIFAAVLERLEGLTLREAADLTPEQKVTRQHEVVGVVDALADGFRDARSGLVHLAGGFRCYARTHWVPVGPAALRRLLTGASVALGIDPTAARYHRFVDDLEKQAASATLTEQPQHDGRVHLLSFANGTLEVTPQGATLRGHRPAELLTHAIPHDYRPDAVCESWQRFLDRVLPDEASQRNLAEFFGSAFTGLKHEKALVLVGDGYNGKSVVFDVVRAVLGPENVTHQSLDDLDREYHRASLAGYLLNYASEIGRSPKADILKKMVSGEPIGVRLPYGKPFIMRRYARLAFNCNELPREVEHTQAFFRRLLIVPFTVRITDGERDPNLAAHIVATEPAGVLNWIIAGMRRLTEQHGFTPNPRAEAALEEYRLESDSVALFMQDGGYAECGADEPGTALSELHKEYREYCSDNIYKAVSSRTMAKRLRSLGYGAVHRNTGTWFLVRGRPRPSRPVAF